MLAEGGHYWKAGIFLMRADAFFAELEKQQPAMAAACSAAFAKARLDGARVYAEVDAFLSIPLNSIDYAVMEDTERIVVAPAYPCWFDVRGGAGRRCTSWAPRTTKATSASATSSRSARRAIISHADEGKRIALVGVSDLVVVAHGDDILITPRDRAQEVNAIVEYLSANPAS